MEINDTLKNITEPDEQIRWSGHPEKFALLDPGNKKKLLIRWIITAVMTLVCLIGYPLIIAGSDVKFSIWIPVIIVIIALYFFLRPVIDVKMLMGRTFVITDRRAAVIYKDGSVKAMMLDRITDVMFIDKNNGCGDVAIGKDAATAKNSKIRAIALVPREDIYSSDDSKISGIVFYNIKDFNAVKEYFLPGTEIHKRNI